MRGYLCRGMYYLLASIFFTRDSVENKSPTDIVILEAILMHCMVYENDICICIRSRGKKGDDGGIKKICENYIRDSSA